MDRKYWARTIEQLDPERDCHEIYRILSAHEFFWDTQTSLSFALFRTYAVPSIGRLLFDTGEFTNRTRKRYDDTALLLEAVSEHGLASAIGRAAVRRINEMHRAYDISNDDMRYVLSTFVVVPIRWIDEYGWRRLTEAERVATANFYRELGRHMGIKGIPADHVEFAILLDEYEAAHFAFDEKGLAVADATLELMTTLPIFRALPKPAMQRFAYALMDQHLLDAFHYPRPASAVRRLARSVMRLRARAMRFLPPRLEPQYHRASPELVTYPNGFEIPQLGTFPRGCPFPHRATEPPRDAGDGSADQRSPLTRPDE